MLTPRNFWISSDQEKVKEFEEVLLSIAISDIYFSHDLIFFLLGFYFIEDEEFFEANQRIEGLLAKVISISRPRFRPV